MPVQKKNTQQLCLPVDELSRILGPKLISSVAITGSDPFLRTGTSLTLIFEAKQKEGLLAALALLEDASKGKISLKRSQYPEKLQNLQITSTKGSLLLIEQSGVSSVHSMNSLS